MYCLYKRLLFVLISLPFYTNGQDSSKAIGLVGQELQNGLSTTQILCDTQFMFLHPNSSFRGLIRKYANSNPLTIVSASEPGERILVNGIVKNKKGHPVKDAVVYCYQTDQRGYYGFKGTHVPGNEGDRRHARLFGYLKTDVQGNFSLQTIHPRGYPNSELPAHIHCEIEVAGKNALITELLFEDDPRLQGAQRSRSLQEGFIIAKADQNRYSYMLIVRDESE